MDARMKQRLFLRDEGCWPHLWSAFVVTVTPDERFGLRQIEESHPINGETVTNYRFVTMLEMLATLGHLGIN